MERLSINDDDRGLLDDGKEKTEIPNDGELMRHLRNAPNVQDERDCGINNESRNNAQHLCQMNTSNTTNIAHVQPVKPFEALEQAERSTPRVLNERPRLAQLAWKRERARLARLVWKSEQARLAQLLPKSERARLAQLVRKDQKARLAEKARPGGQAPLDWESWEARQAELLQQVQQRQQATTREQCYPSQPIISGNNANLIDMLEPIHFGRAAKLEGPSTPSQPVNSRRYTNLVNTQSVSPPGSSENLLLCNPSTASERLLNENDNAGNPDFAEPENESFFNAIGGSSKIDLSESHASPTSNDALQLPFGNCCQPLGYSRPVPNFAANIQEIMLTEEQVERTPSPPPVDDNLWTFND